jgi:hypothetical protein
MREAGYSQTELWVPAENQRARRFYERNGWEHAPEPRRTTALGLVMTRYQRSLGD